MNEDWRYLWVGCGVGNFEAIVIVASPAFDHDGSIILLIIRFFDDREFCHFGWRFAIRTLNVLSLESGINGREIPSEIPVFSFFLY